MKNMIKELELDALVSSAVKHIIEAQNADGSFTSLSSSSPDDFNNAKTYHTTFFTSLVMGCLNSGKQELDVVIQKGAQFLLSQKSSQWSFNYWTRQSTEYSSLPYPDDLDDTFCALGALQKHVPDSISGDALAKISQLLIATEQETGGPYRTWLMNQSSTTDQRWFDIDVAVNSNIAWFLGQHGVVLPHIVMLIERAIITDNYHSPYYPSEFPVIYFISRWYVGEQREALKNKARSLLQQAIDSGSLHDCALMISALCNFGVPVREFHDAVCHLIALHNAAGTWQPYPFCMDPSRDGKKYYAGCSALTAALCVEAVEGYQRLVEKERSHNSSSVQQRMHESIIMDVEKSLDQAGPQIAEYGKGFLKIMIEKDTHHNISLLPLYFAEAISTPVPSTLLRTLGVANVHGWMAYTIYDHVMDESKDIELLPVANVCSRQLQNSFNSLHIEGLAPVFEAVMNGIDEANAWEIAHARTNVMNIVVPDYGDLHHLSDRSFGHALGPLAIMMSSGFIPGSMQYEGIKKFLYHYLIARQLNDDAHDLEDDLSRGQLTSVAEWLLEEYMKDINGDLLSLERDMPKLQKLFWNSTITKVNEKILWHCEQARSAIDQSGIEVSDAFIAAMIGPFERAVAKAVHEVAIAQQFVKTFAEL